MTTADDAAAVDVTSPDALTLAVELSGLDYDEAELAALVKYLGVEREELAERWPDYDEEELSTLVCKALGLELDEEEPYSDDEEERLMWPVLFVYASDLAKGRKCDALANCWTGRRVVPSSRAPRRRHAATAHSGRSPPDDDEGDLDPPPRRAA